MQNSVSVEAALNSTAITFFFLEQIGSDPGDEQIEAEVEDLLVRSSLGSSDLQVEADHNFFYLFPISGLQMSKWSILDNISR